VTYNTPVLLWIKNETVLYIECYSMSTYKGVTCFQKTVRCFRPPCTYTRNTKEKQNKLP